MQSLLKQVHFCCVMVTALRLDIRSPPGRDRGAGTERQACTLSWERSCPLGAQVQDVTLQWGPCCPHGQSQLRRCQPAWPGPCALRTRPTAPPAGLRPPPPPLHTTASCKGFLTLAAGSPWCHRPGQKNESPPCSLWLVSDLSRSLMTCRLRECWCNFGFSVVSVCTAWLLRSLPEHNNHETSSRLQSPRVSMGYTWSWLCRDSPRLKRGWCCVCRVSRSCPSPNCTALFLFLSLQREYDILGGNMSFSWLLPRSWQHLFLTPMYIYKVFSVWFHSLSV